jgi:hypothetical protein
VPDCVRLRGRILAVVREGQEGRSAGGIANEGGPHLAGVGVPRLDRKQEFGGKG